MQPQIGYFTASANRPTASSRALIDFRRFALCATVVITPQDSMRGGIHSIKGPARPPWMPSRPLTRDLGARLNGPLGQALSFYLSLIVSAEDTKKPRKTVAQLLLPLLSRLRCIARAWQFIEPRSRADGLRRLSCGVADGLRLGFRDDSAFAAPAPWPDVGLSGSRPQLSSSTGGTVWHRPAWLSGCGTAASRSVRSAQPHGTVQDQTPTSS